MVRGDPVCRKEDCSQYDIGLVFKEISSYSDQDKVKFLENVWKPVIAMENFLRNMTRESVPIDQQINNLLQQQIKRNREILKSLFKTIIFCGKNNIALRGPQALLEFRIDSGDQTLQHHPETAPTNATYISKTIQNEMITTVGAIIMNNLSQEIRDSKYFPIMSDEAADISNKENLSVVIRFLDSSKTVREEFVGFYLCEDGTTGVAIIDLIIGGVADLGLSMDD